MAETPMALPAPNTPRLVGFGVGAFLMTEIVMVACAFFWVFIYSVLINTGGDQSFYEAYAQVASPVVAVVVAGPVFYVMGRVLMRLGPRARSVAIVVVVANLAVDLPVVVLAAEDLGYNLTMSVFAAAGKIFGALYATRSSTT